LPRHLSREAQIAPEVKNLVEKRHFRVTFRVSVEVEAEGWDEAVEEACELHELYTTDSLYSVRELTDEYH